MGNIQFIQITPEELQNSISGDIQKKLDELAKGFQPKEPTEYLTRKEVAELFKVDLSTIHNWVKKGKLKPYGIGGRVYFKRHQVESALIEL